MDDLSLFPVTWGLLFWMTGHEQLSEFFGEKNVQSINLKSLIRDY